jgi:hypothetical protein
MIIIGIILYLVGAVTICICVKGDLIGLLGTILVSIGTAAIIKGGDVDSPSAIDAYRGKTTLEITSVNGVP